MIDWTGSQSVLESGTRPTQPRQLQGPIAGRLSLVQHRQASGPNRTIAGGNSFAPNSVAFDRMLFQRGPVGRGNHALRRQDTGCWAARNPFGPDKFGNRRFPIVLKGDLS
jgi:hypothetical protein